MFDNNIDLEKLKHRYFILVLLCLIVGNTTSLAQLYSTSSSEFHSYGSGAYTPAIGTTDFSSTSRFSTTTTISSYSTAPMHVANGGFQTVANQLDDITFADDLIGGGSTTGETGFIPTDPQRSTIAPPTIAPLGLDWDTFLLLLSLVALYAFRLYRKSRTTIPIAHCQ